MKGGSVFYAAERPPRRCPARLCRWVMRWRLRKFRTMGYVDREGL